MKKKQEEHLELLKTIHAGMLDEKYRKGAKKYKSDLLTMSPKKLLYEALEENIDQFVYLITAFNKL